MASLLSIFFWLDLVDIATVGVLLFLAIRFVRRTRGRRALTGLTLLGGVYLLARALDLELTASLFQGFFAVLVLVIVVVFQEDLRRLFEQLGTLRRGGSRERRGVDVADVIVRAVARLRGARARGISRKGCRRCAARGRRRPASRGGATARAWMRCSPPRARSRSGSCSCRARRSPR